MGVPRDCVCCVSWTVSWRSISEDGVGSCGREEVPAGWSSSLSLFSRCFREVKNWACGECDFFILRFCNCSIRVSDNLILADLGEVGSSFILKPSLYESRNIKAFLFLNV